MISRRLRAHARRLRPVLALTALNIMCALLVSAPTVAKGIDYSAGVTKAVADTLYCKLTGCTMTGVIAGQSNTCASPTYQFANSSTTGLAYDGTTERMCLGTTQWLGLAGATMTLGANGGTVNIVPAITSGSTTTNTYGSNVVATGGVDTFWEWDAIVTNASDIHTQWCAGGACGMTYAQTNGSAGAPLLGFAGGVFTVGVASGQGQILSTASGAGANVTLRSGANASGEVGVSLETSANLSGATLDTTLMQVAHNSGTTVVAKVNGAGHVTITGSVPSSYTSGTCTSETGTGDDTHGTVTATCTAQTWIVSFNRSYAAAPVCTVQPMNAAASAGAASFVYTTSTAALTATVTTATTAGTWAFHCIE